VTTKTVWTASEIEDAMANSSPAPREDAKVALVQFDGSTKTYCYWLLPGTTTKKAVVQSPYNGPTTVTVVDVKSAAELGFVRLKLAVTPSQFSRMERAKRAREANITPVHTTGNSEIYAMHHHGSEVYSQFAERFAKRFAARAAPIPLNNLNTRINLGDNSKEHSTMNIEITNATFINGTNVKDFTDSQLMGMMQQLDKDIAQLKAMEPLPKRFAKRLEKLETSKQALFELLDSAE